MLKPSHRTLLLVVLVTSFNFISQAQGDLLITPRRILFEGGKRSEEINLVNIGRDTATYVISFNQIRMNENGNFENIASPDSGQFFADKNLRIFPRTVKLAPNEAQTLKVQISKVDQLSEGEYRSHIYFRAQPEQRPLGDDVHAINDSSLTIKLVPVYGISIPAIIRKGSLDAHVTISDLEIEKDTSLVVKMYFNRSGNQSVYGDIAIEHFSNSGTGTKVADAVGVAVYTPTKKRLIRMPLKSATGADFSSGKLRITYTEQAPKNTILAQSEISLD